MRLYLNKVKQGAFWKGCENFFFSAPQTQWPPNATYKTPPPQLLFSWSWNKAQRTMGGGVHTNTGKAPWSRLGGCFYLEASIMAKRSNYLPIAKTAARFGDVPCQDEEALGCRLWPRQPKEDEYSNASVAYVHKYSLNIHHIIIAGKEHQQLLGAPQLGRLRKQRIRGLSDALGAMAAFVKHATAA